MMITCLCNIKTIFPSYFKVGCGGVQYFSGQMYSKVLVCDYGPGGNVIGLSMYEQGVACSKCPAGTSCIEGVLCSSEQGKC